MFLPLRAVRRIFPPLLCLGALSLSLAVSPASANLIVNGSFELAPVGSGQVNGNLFAAMPGQTGTRSWDVWGPASGELPGWITVAGPGIELQTRRTIGITPQAGHYYAELRSHGGASLFAFKQIVNVDAMLANTVATLSFWHRDRAGGNNGFAVDFNGAQLVEILLNNTAPDWTLKSVAVTLLAGPNEVLFRSLGTSSKTLGQLFDDISLNAVAVPLPGTFALLLAGLGGLVTVRRFARPV